jgi:hypothetical protein
MINNNPRAYIRYCYEHDDNSWIVMFKNCDGENRFIARYIWGMQSKELARAYARIINNRVKQNPSYEPE